jgi:hypothetical protein
MVFGSGDYRGDTERQSRGNSVKRRGNPQMGRILPGVSWRQLARKALAAWAQPRHRTSGSRPVAAAFSSPCTAGHAGARAGGVLATARRPAGPCRSPCTGSSGARACTGHSASVLAGPCVLAGHTLFLSPTRRTYCKTRSSSCCRFHCRFRLCVCVRADANFARWR